MILDLDKVVQNPLFLRLKEVVENNGYHDHQDVYSHLLLTKDIALKEIKGEFITNSEAKSSFQSFINQDFHGFKKEDIMILIALLHDIGKILTVNEGHNRHPLLVINESGITSCPGHEYWGSTIVESVLKDLALSKEVINYIASVIKLHDTFSAEYFQVRSNMNWNLLINDVKSRAEGLYKEALFNIYCDCFSAVPFQKAKKMIIKLFNTSELYTERQYVIS